jgi:hypothetical protein
MLLREEYIAALAHEDPVVRNDALELVTRCHAGGLDATRQSLRALEEHGLFGAFHDHNSLRAFPLERADAEKLLDLLHKQIHEGIPHLALEWLLAKAPVDFLREHRSEVLRLGKELHGPFLKGFAQQRLQERFRFADSPHAELLERLDQLPSKCSLDKSSYPGTFVTEAETIIEILGANPDFRGELEARANAWIALEIAEESPEIAEGEPPVLDNFWPAMFGVKIAGTLRMAHTVPTLVKLLGLDSDYMSEWVADALAEMNSIHTLQAWEELYPHLEWHERLYLGGTCEHISEPGVDTFLERLLENEDDPDLIERLVTALSIQPSIRATQIAADYYRENDDNPEAQEIAENLYTRHILLGLDHPDLNLWREHCNKTQARLTRNRLGLPHPAPAVPIIASAAPGRNDPCRCGSGKKYKKCCLPTGA